MNTEFEILEHIADTGIIAYGSNLKKAFENAAKGMFNLITDIEVIQINQTRNIEVDSPDIESLLVNWLNELIYIFDTENLVFRQFKITHLDSSSLSAIADGQRIDPSRHELKTGIKAATYHMLKIEEGDTCRIQVLFDI